jgi:hypothetical protein
LCNEKRGLINAFEEILMSEPEIQSTSSLRDGYTSQREEQISALIEKKLAVMNETQWRFRVCGRSVEVREQVDRVVKVIFVAKETLFLLL